MVRDTIKLSLLALLVLGGTAGVWTYYNKFTSAGRIRQLEEEKRILQGVVARLTAERRVAEMLVTDQMVENGVKKSTLLFVEYGRDGKPLPPRTFTVKGEEAHVDGLVIKFEPELVGKGDEFKGKSIALFTRIYGDAEAPEAGAKIDEPNQIPAIYQGADPKVTDFEMNLWRNFWKLAYDEAARKEQGVRALVGQGVHEPVRKDWLYTLTLENNGGLNLTREPLRGIYREALKANATTTTRENPR